MPLRLFLPCLALAVLVALTALTGCSKPWSNPQIEDSHKAEAQFERDSVDCEVVAGEKYPLDKNRQIEVYDQCMIDKGWVRERRGDGIPIKPRRK